jgi:aldose 1-epimerase
MRNNQYFGRNGFVSIIKTPFGTDSLGRPVTLYTMRNANGAEAAVINHGARLVSVRVPDRTGKLDDVCIGFDTLEPYLGKQSYTGASIGRVGNRIGKGSFTLGGREYGLGKNERGNTLHGGMEGFDKKWWIAETMESKTEDMVLFTYNSHDGEEGFPGDLRTQISYSWDKDNSLTIMYIAQGSKDTPVNLTNHAYFNLSGKGDILDHTLQIHAQAVTEVDDELIPTGVSVSVKGTPFDMNTPIRIRDGIARRAEQHMLDHANGYDINYELAGSGMRECAVLREPVSARVMRVFTDQPAVQLYTGQHFNDVGHGGALYKAHAGLALETQHYPDSVHYGHFPSIILHAGDTYRTKSIYAFKVEA